VRALRAHHRRHYTTSSAVLSLAGRLPSHDKLFKLVSEAFGAMAKGRPVRFRPLSGPATGPHLVVRHTSSSQASVRVGFVGPGRRDPDEPAIELLLRVVDDGTSTRLYERLCDRGGLCYEVSAGFEAYDEVSLFDFAAETRPGASARVLSALLSICKELAEHGPTEDEMSKAKRRAKWFAERALDQPEAFAEHVGHSALHGKPLTPTDRYARMAAVTRDDVRDAAARLFTPERLGVAIVGPVSSAMDARVERLVERFC
jgi:predicted Zn-dependent peptidase